ncbi:hypothetical protein [Actinokineospora sp. HUAS TT18]|uniref:hypothetical protein n=1 Tax=Actinokineospora sp. HUAS TT18 TaxID=3447451 RepID=UPI003F51ADB8
MRTPLLAACLTLGVLTGCSTQVASAPPSTAGTTATPTSSSVAPKPRAVDPANMTAAAVFGGDMLGVDVETDLCGFLRPEDLKGADTARVGDPRGFGTCAIEVSRRAGAVKIKVGRFFDVAAHPVEGEPKALPGGLKEYGGGPAPDCASQVVFPDKVGLRVWGEGDAADLCHLVRVAIDAMVARFDDGTVAPRPVAPDSLSRYDACEFLPKDLTRVVPGVWAGQEARSDRHSCSTGRSDKAWAYVAFKAGYAPVADGRSESEVLAGRPTVVLQRPGHEGDAFYCQASTSIRAREDKELPGAAEYVLAEVGYRVEPKDCSAAKALAEVLWPKLPA